MVDLVLRAEPRTVLGKQVKALRRAGRLPGIVYGPVVQETVPVTVDARELAKFYQTFGGSTLFTLEWEGGSQQVFIREVQVEPVRHTPVHVDFFAPNLRQEITATVAVVAGEASPEAVGVLNVALNELPVTALPTDIPGQVNVDASTLREVGDAIRIGDLSLPRGVRVLLPEDEIIVHLMAEVIEEEPEVEEAADVEAEAEGAEGEPAEAGATDDLTPAADTSGDES